MGKAGVLVTVGGLPRSWRRRGGEEGGGGDVGKGVSAAVVTVGAGPVSCALGGAGGGRGQGMVLVTQW